MIRWIATVTAGAVLAAGLACHPAAHAAPQSTPQSAPQTASQAAQQSEQQPVPAMPDAVSPPQPTPPPSRKPHRGGGGSPSAGNVMRGGDTPSLVAVLPWWRPDGSRPPGSDPGQLESPVLTACDVWLGFPFRLSAAQHASEIDFVANKIWVIDPGELNEIDLTAPDEPQSTRAAWLRGLLAILGGALAAFSAVRYLVT